MFLDDELDLDQKIQFVGKIQSDSLFTAQTLDLLEQEKLLKAPMVQQLPAVELQPRRRFTFNWLRPVALAAAVAAALLVFTLLNRPAGKLPAQLPHRFVLYLPQARNASIVGSFTDWRPVPMHKVDSSGYWVLDMKLPLGEHRYSYLVEGNQLMPDPTITAREPDDFGGQNSIIEVKMKL